MERKPSALDLSDPVLGCNRASECQHALQSLLNYFFYGRKNSRMAIREAEGEMPAAKDVDPSLTGS